MGGTGRREGREGKSKREGKGLKPPKVNFLVTSLSNIYGSFRCCAAKEAEGTWWSSEEQMSTS
jgi:hypothetical protein